MVVQSKAMTFRRKQRMDVANLISLERSLAKTQQKAEKMGLTLVSSLISMAMIDINIELADTEVPRHLDS